MVCCCVPGCQSNASLPDVSFYRFPAIRSDEGGRELSVLRRNAWLKAVNRRNIDANYALVCSQHFVSGQPAKLFDDLAMNWVPTLQLDREPDSVLVPDTISVSDDVTNKNPVPIDVEKNIQSSLLVVQPDLTTRDSYRENLLKDILITDSAKVCRLCLGKEVKLTRPFQDDSGMDIALLRQIYDCTTVKITLKTSYPDAICAICDTKLIEYSRFREKCIENDNILRMILDGDSDSESGDEVEPFQESEEPEVEAVEFTESEEPELEAVEFKESEEPEVEAVEFKESEEPEVEAVEFRESEELKDLQLQLYGSSDEATVSQSEFVGSEEPSTQSDGSSNDKASPAPLPTIKRITSKASVKSVVAAPASNGSPEPEPEPMIEIPAPTRPRIAVKPISSLASPAVTSGLVSPLAISGLASPVATSGLASPVATSNLASPVATSSLASSATTSTEQNTPELLTGFTISAEQALQQSPVPAVIAADGRLECVICARPFRNTYTLRRHMNLHTEENLFTCEFCGKKFNDRSNWKIHLRAHTGDDLLRCAVCFKSFISPSTLKYHLRAHRKLKVFECRLCEESLTTYDLLADHVSSKHSDIRPEDLAKSADDNMFVAGDFLKIEMEGDETTLSAAIAGLSEGADAPSMPGSLMPASTMDLDGQIKIKKEMLDPDEIEIKQEPVEDDTLEPDPDGEKNTQEGLAAMLPGAEEETAPVILFRCDYCMKIFKYLYELRVHMKMHNGTKLSGKDGEKSASGTLVLPPDQPPAKKPRHPSIDEDVGELENAPLPEHKCNKCDKCFRTEELLKVHINTHKTDDDVTQARSCKICLKTFKCELNLVSHMRKHHPYESYVSEKQQASLDDKPQSPDSSSNDANQSHSESPESSKTAEVATVDRRCEICALSFDCVFKLEKHVLTHFRNNEAVSFVPSADRPYKCTECHKRFKRKDYLLIHIRTHTGERRHKCDMCSSAFVHPSNLITHRKLHSNERPFKCDLCPAAFKLYAGLKIHRKRCALKYLQENSLTIT